VQGYAQEALGLPAVQVEEPQGDVEVMGWQPPTISAKPVQIGKISFDLTGMMPTYPERVLIRPDVIRLSDGIYWTG
jgi:hypothetical protein